MTSPRPLPPTDLDSTPWWQALARGELVLQRCECSRFRWPLRAMCSECGLFTAELVAASGTGTVLSWTATYHSFGPTIEVPFVVALVRLDEQDDIVIPGYVDTPGDGSAMSPAMRVHAGFIEVDTAEGKPLTLIRWRPI